jgi:ABC-type Fe3+/spermidine/putrescine transport system ATPase subunit
MFQDHQLFPQRDVAGNVAFGLRMHGEPKRQQAEQVQELLELVGLPSRCCPAGSSSELRWRGPSHRARGC